MPMIFHMVDSNILAREASQMQNYIDPYPTSFDGEESHSAMWLLLEGIALTLTHILRGLAVNANEVGADGTLQELFKLVHDLLMICKHQNLAVSVCRQRN